MGSSAAAPKAAVSEAPAAGNHGAPEPVKSGKVGIAKYAAAILLVVIIIGAAIFAGAYFNQGGSGGNFETFKGNFNSAPRVALLVTGYNGTVLSGTVGCATAIIQEVVANKVAHRNASTIDYGILNQTSCIEVKGLTATATSNYSTTSVQNCLNLTKSEPTIFINYSTKGNTTIIKPNYLYIAGTYKFLRECGVASQIS